MTQIFQVEQKEAASMLLQENLQAVQTALTASEESLLAREAVIADLKAVQSDMEKQLQNSAQSLALAEGEHPQAPTHTSYIYR